jgi:hypothetical protein
VDEEAISRLDRSYELDTHHASLPLWILAQSVRLARLHNGDGDRYISTDETPLHE